MDNTVSSPRDLFTAALDRLIEQVKQDRSILAAILGGSLSHDKVWAKSDIDLVLITADDRQADRGDDASCALYSEGVNIHAILLSRAAFRKTVEGSLHNSFMHSFLAKGRLLYSHDPTIADLAASLAAIGARDTGLQLLRAGCHALPPIYKAHKFFETRGDLHYTALWILGAANALARIEILSRRLLADREVIPQALALNPPFFRTVYLDLLSSAPSRDSIQAALDAVDRYVAVRTPDLFGAVLDYLREVRDTRSASEIETHFVRHHGIEGVTTACEYLADQQLIGKASAPRRLTKRSNVDVQELAFFAID